MSPQSPTDVYLIAIGGTGMAPLACLLKRAGCQVRGSDGPLYPPMSTLLENEGIEPVRGPDPSNLKPRPDLVIVGNAVHRNNPEATFVEQAGIERISMPQALSRFFLEGRKPLVVAGTHGKTTTSSIAAFVYDRCGGDPGYLIGGIPLDLPGSFSIGTGPRFVVEGDEYNAAYFDREAKFLHYQPHTVILTGVEYDHADLYPDPASFRESFRRLVSLLPVDGHLIACVDTPEVRELVEEAPCRVTRYGLTSHAELRPLGELESSSSGTVITIEDAEAGRQQLELSVWGAHNVSNALAVWAAARGDGIAPDDVARALKSFRGVKRRLEERGRPGDVVVVDDFAHHPTEIAASLRGLRDRYVGQRIVAAFEPRSLTAGREFLFDAYRAAFEDADHVLLAPIFHAKRFEPEELLDLDRLAQTLVEAGVAAEALSDTDSVLERAIDVAKAGDVVVTMSSGGFDDLPNRLLEAFGQ